MQEQRVKEMLQISLDSESHLSWRELMRVLPRFQQKLLVIVHENPMADVETIAKYAFSTSQSVSSTLKILKKYRLVESFPDTSDKRHTLYKIKHSGLERCFNGYALKP